MRKPNNKQRKGFTIVELVIVIAVVAVLAGVMIPTFGGIIETANRSADTQLVAQINTILFVEEELGGGVNDAVEIQKIVEENGLKLETKSKGSLLLYDKSNSRVVLGTLVEGSDEVIITDPSAGTVAKVIISGDRPVLLSDGSGNGATVVVNNKNDSSNTAKFRQGITLLDEFIEGYLNITKKSRDGLAQAICEIRDATDWYDITKENGLLSKITKINPTLGNNLATYMSQVAIITTGEDIISSGNLASAKYLLVNSGVTKITQTIVDKLEGCENISIIDFSSNITEIEPDVFDALNALGKKVSINDDEIKTLDDQKDPTNTNNIFHVSERDLHVEKLVLVHRIDGSNIGTGEKIAEYGKDVVDYPVNLPYQVYPCTTANKAYKFKGYSFYEDGSNSIQYGATDYPLSEQQRAMAVGGQLTIYAIYEQVDADFMVGNSYYESAGMTHKLSKGEITSGTITVVSNDATLDATLIGLANTTLTIPSGVELLVPTESLAKLSKALVSESFVKVNKDTVAGKTKLTIKNGVELVVEPNAKVYVDAKLYTYGTYYQCFTKEDCGVLVLEDGSKITSDGTITAYGVIRGDGDIVVNDGELIEIMTIYDWYGGSNAAAAVGVEGGLGSLAGAFTDIPLDGKQVVPFNEWRAENIRVTTTVKASALYKAETGILLNNDVFVDFELTSGSSSDQPLFLLEPDTYIERSVSNDGDAKITIYGNASDTSKQMVIEGIVSGMGTATIDFSKIALPLSHFDVNISEGSMFTISKNIYKVMPGSEIVVDGKLNISGDAKVVICNTYDQKFALDQTTVYTKEVTGIGNTTRNKLTFTLSADGKSINIVCQPEKKGWLSSKWSNDGSSTTATIIIPLTYSVTTPAKLVINGELHFAGNAVFAGEITSRKSGATVTATNTVNGHTIPTGWYIQSNSTGYWYNTYSEGMHSSAVINGVAQTLSGNYVYGSITVDGTTTTGWVAQQ